MFTHHTEYTRQVSHQPFLVIALHVEYLIVSNKIEVSQLWYDSMTQITRKKGGLETFEDKKDKNTR